MLMVLVTPKNVNVMFVAGLDFPSSEINRFLLCGVQVKRPERAPWCLCLTSGSRKSPLALWPAAYRRAFP